MRSTRCCWTRRRTAGLANGHTPQRPNLPVYLPSNGGLLAAIAMMAAGWDGAPARHAPGFPDDGSWVVRVEGIGKGHRHIPRHADAEFSRHHENLGRFLPFLGGQQIIPGPSASSYIFILSAFDGASYALHRFRKRIFR